jgi:type I restriction enzyme R subunit
MIAVLEAKAETYAADAGLEQAKSYAAMLDVPFAYSSNGASFVEFDFFLNQSREQVMFPTPEELWQRWELYRSQTDTSERKQGGSGKPIVTESKIPYGLPSTKQSNPLLYPYCPRSISGKDVRYFQEVAIRRVIERMMRGQKRILLTMATGTGKTFTALQLVHIGENNPSVYAVKAFP